MDDTEDDAGYPVNSYAMNHQQGYGKFICYESPASREKLPVRNAPYSRVVGNQYADGDGDAEEEDEDELVDEDGENNQSNGIRYVGKDVDDGEEEEDDEDGDEDIDEEDGEDNNQKSYDRRIDENNLEKHPKKQKIKSLVSSYEFAPRLPALPAGLAPPAAPPKSSYAGRNPLTDWTERETFVLLEAWGDKFLQRGRKSLRSEEWQEVAEKVSETSKIERTDTQCRNRLDTLKKKYKKEKISVAEAGTGATRWVYFKKMDMLMSSSAQQGGLSCGVDSGEYVFMNPRVYLNCANGSDEMRDSPGNSESADDEDVSDGLPPKKRKFRKERNEGSSSLTVLADSIQKFSDIYERIENSKRQQMLELEKMRMDFHRDLETQRRQIMERAQAEIAKIQHESGISADNGSL